MALAKHEEHSNGGQGGRRCSHFLVVVYGIQGHLNPARALARRLAQIGGCTVTLSVPISGHRRMFPSQLENSDEEVNDGVISYAPFSDGKDDGSWSKDLEERTQRREASFKSLSAVVNRLAARGRPVTCVVCTLNIPVVVDVAHEHKLPLAIYWIQPATALVAYYHYFHGLDQLLAQHASNPTYEVNLPGMHPLTIRDMPSFLIERTHSEMSKMILQGFHDLFKQFDQERPMVMVNTFTALEDTALKAIQPYVDVFPVGPAVPPLDSSHCRKASEGQIHLFKQDEKNYMEWLSEQPEKSVVYLSFGSLLTYTKRQVDEILFGLQSCGRPYLWVVRKDGREEEVEFCLGDGKGDKGMVVEWCDQLQVLSHPSVGCFVTHCGWNSTLEAIVSGVPIVAVPNWSDQPLNAHLIEKVWNVGVRAERDAEGVLTRMELVNCVELLMGGNEKATSIKANASNLKERARDAVATDGPLERSLQSFVKRSQDLFI
ncbi:hypothetical protein ACP70R_020418 [Stipagrostis hirtigluma subsp. patula]